MITNETFPPQEDSAGYRRVRLRGSVRVPVDPKAAFLLFTPLGEERWAEGWDPHFLTPSDDDSEPGTVFEVLHGSQSSTWIVCGRELERSISYARVVPGRSAGTITVTLDARLEGSVATIEYDLTALSHAAEAELATFASHYEQFLAGWERAIAEVTRPRTRELPDELSG
jgi:hypothetical protein